MKRLTCMFIVSLCTISSFGQLQVNSSGNVSAQKNLNVVESAIINGGLTLGKELSLSGITGIKGRGVLHVTSSSVAPGWGPTTVGLKSLISAECEEMEYGFANYHYGIPNFYVSYNGMVYTRYGLVQTSDSICKKNVVPLSSTLNKLQALNGVSFDYKENNSNSKYKSIESQSNVSNDNTGMSDIQRQIESEKSRKRIGLIAQDVEKIYPEVVRTQYDGTKGIMYSDLVAILIEGIKELNTQVETLQQQVELLQNKENTQTPKQNGDSHKSSPMKQKAVLYQNTPNPFNQETEIAYRIPDNVTASICIYNLNGQQLKKYPITDTNGKVLVSASEFIAGIYIYSLIIDNQIADSKRMVLTD